MQLFETEGSVNTEKVNRLINFEGKSKLIQANESLFCMQKRFASVLAKVVRILGLYYLYLAVVMVVGNWFCNMSGL